jgi:hypothetical protein
MTIVQRLSLVLALSVCALAGGQELDGTVSNVPVSIKAHLATEQSPWTRMSARQFLAQLLEDRQLVGWEKELLIELTSPNSDVVEVHFSGGDSLAVPHPEGEAAAQLEYLVKPTNFEELWNGGPDDMARLVDFSTLHPLLDMKVRHYLAGHFHTKWQKSSVNNSYKPLREEIDRAVEVMKKSGDETYSSGRNLIFESCELLDARLKGTVPNFLYDWTQGPPEDR